MLEVSGPPGTRKRQIISDPQRLFHPWVKPEGIPGHALPAGCWHSGHFDVQERRAGWNLAVEVLMRGCAQRPWGWLGSGFLRKIPADGIFEEGGSVWGAILEKGCEFVKCEDDSSGISSQPCWPTVLDKCVLTIKGGKNHQNQVPENWINPSALSWTALQLWGCDHKHCGAYNQLSQGLCKPQISHCPPRDERINTSNSAKWSIAQFCRL